MRRSRMVRLSRPMEIERWVRRGDKMGGGSVGSGGRSWDVRDGAEVGVKGVGRFVWRYQGV